MDELMFRRLKYSPVRPFLNEEFDLFFVMNERSEKAFAPKGFKTRFVLVVKTVTKRDETLDTNVIGPATKSPTLSGFLSAMDFGTSSPIMRVKYEIAMTTIPIEIGPAPFAINGMGTLASIGSKVVTDAAPPIAEERAPITVTPICIVARSLSGSAWSFNSLRAR